MPEPRDTVRAGIPGNARWLMLLLCFIGVFINYLDRTNFSVAAPLMAKDINLSPSELGLLFGSFFFIYSIVVVPIGALVDRFGPRGSYPIFMVLWSAASAGTGLAGSVGPLLVSRSVMGGGEASCFPTNSKVVSEWFPHHQRATATSLWHVGIGLSSAASIPLVGYLILQYGWRLSFVITAAAGILFALLWYLVYRDPRPEERPQTAFDAAPLAGRLPWWRLARHRTVWGLALGFFCANTINSFFMGWFPSYLMHERGFTLQQVTTVGALPAVSALIGGLLGGIMADLLYRRGFTINVARKTCLVGGLVASSLVAVGVLVSDITVAFVFFSLSYAGIAFTSANIQSVPMEIAPSKAEVASVTAISTVGGAFAGLVGNWLVGVFIQLMGGSYVATIVGVGAFALVAALVYLFVVGPIRPLSRDELGLPRASEPPARSVLA